MVACVMVSLHPFVRRSLTSCEAYINFEIKFSTKPFGFAPVAVRHVKGERRSHLMISTLLHWIVGTLSCYNCRGSRGEPEYLISVVDR